MPQRGSFGGGREDPDEGRVIVLRGLEAAVGRVRGLERQGPFLWGRQHGQGPGFCSKHHGSCWRVVSSDRKGPTP